MSTNLTQTRHPLAGDPSAHKLRRRRVRITTRRLTNWIIRFLRPLGLVRTPAKRRPNPTWKAVCTRKLLKLVDSHISYAPPAPALRQARLHEIKDWMEQIGDERFTHTLDQLYRMAETQARKRTNQMDQRSDRARWVSYP